MKNALVYACLVMILMASLGLWNGISEKKAYESGRDVLVDVIKPHRCGSGPKNPWVTVMYNEREYNVPVSGNYCEHENDFQIVMRLSPDGEQLFFIGEDFDAIGVCSLFIAVGLFCMIKEIIRNRKNKQMMPG